MGESEIYHPSPLRSMVFEIYYSFTIFRHIARRIQRKNTWQNWSLTSTICVIYTRLACKKR